MDEPNERWEGDTHWMAQAASLSISTTQRGVHWLASDKPFLPTFLYLLMDTWSCSLNSDPGRWFPFMYLTSSKVLYTSWKSPRSVNEFFCLTYLQNSKEWFVRLLGTLLLLTVTKGRGYRVIPPKVPCLMAGGTSLRIVVALRVSLQVWLEASTH